VSLKITLVRVEITLVRVEITLVCVKITFVPVEITLLRVVVADLFFFCLLGSYPHYLPLFPTMDPRLKGRDNG
jgi:hypothetical protein